VSEGAEGSTLVVGDGPPGVLLARGLSNLGAAVTVLGDPNVSRAAGEGWSGRSSPCDLTSSTTAEASLRATLEPGPLKALVWARVPVTPGDIGELASLGEEDWERLAEEPITEFLHLLQGASTHLPPGSSVALVAPSLVLVGAPQVVAWTAAVEGQRSLLRVAARRWGNRGVSLNCVAVPAHVLCGAPAPLDRAGGPPPSSGRQPTIDGEVATVVAHLAAMAGSVTGATVAVDGGSWMTP
jgi:NAD(P)-dependent dehydrogenase (short-subunit alcohol dehydrogenase family)